MRLLLSTIVLRWPSCVIKLNRPTERPNGNTSADALDCERPSSASLAQLFVQLVCDTVVVSINSSSRESHRLACRNICTRRMSQSQVISPKGGHWELLENKNNNKKREMEKPMRLLAVTETHFPSYNIFITASSSSASEKSLKNAS